MLRLVLRVLILGPVFLIAAAVFVLIYPLMRLLFWLMEDSDGSKLSGDLLSALKEMLLILRDGMR